MVALNQMGSEIMFERAEEIITARSRSSVQTYRFRCRCEYFEVEIDYVGSVQSAGSITNPASTINLDMIFK